MSEQSAAESAKCDCDYWHSEHRWHCATNYPTRSTPPTQETQ